MIAAENYRDQDKQLTVFTREMGKILLIAEGATGKGRNTSLAMPFTEMEFTTSQPLGVYNLYFLRQGLVRKSFPRIYRSELMLANAVYFLNLIDALVDFGQQDAKLYDFLREYLGLTDFASPQEFNNLTLVMSLRALSLCGHPVTANHCKGVRKKREWENILNSDLMSLSKIEFDPDFTASMMQYVANVVGCEIPGSKYLQTIRKGNSHE